MMNVTCKSCIFTEVCDEKMKDCDYYYSTEEKDDTQFIEEKRDEFYRDWFRYIGEYEDDLFF